MIWQTTPNVIVKYGDRPRSSSIPNSGEKAAYVRPSKLNIIPDIVLSRLKLSLKNGSSVGVNQDIDISDITKIMNGMVIAAVAKSLR